MEAFLYTLAAAAMSGLAWTAYNHPDGYKRLYYPMIFGSLMVFGAIILHSIAVGQGYVAVFPYLKPGTAEAADRAVNSVRLDATVCLLVFLGFNAYASFLYWLHELIGPKRKD